MCARLSAFITVVEGCGREQKQRLQIILFGVAFCKCGVTEDFHAVVLVKATWPRRTPKTVDDFATISTLRFRSLYSSLRSELHFTKFNGRFDIADEWLPWIAVPVTVLISKT